MPSPMSLSLDYLRRNGFTVDIAERWLRGVNVRKDLFGAFDLVALDRREPAIIGIQVTTTAHMNDRLKKIQAKPELALWLKCGGRAWVIGWKKRGGRWQEKIIEVQAGDLEAVPILDRRPRRGRRLRQRELFE